MNTVKGKLIYSDDSGERVIVHPETTTDNIYTPDGVPLMTAVNQMISQGLSQAITTALEAEY